MKIETQLQPHTEILNKLLHDVLESKLLKEHEREAATEELKKYVKFNFNNLEVLRERWNLLTDDEEQATKRLERDIFEGDKPLIFLEKCKARITYNIIYGKELKKIHEGKN